MHQPVVQHFYYTLVWMVVFTLVQDLFGYSNYNTKVIPVWGDIVSKSDQQVIQI